MTVLFTTSPRHGPIYSYYYLQVQTCEGRTRCTRRTTDLITYLPTDLPSAQQSTFQREKTGNAFTTEDIRR